MKVPFITKRKGFFLIRFPDSYGFAIKDTRIHKLLFSERNGYVKGFRFRHWFIKFYQPEKRQSV